MVLVSTTHDRPACCEQVVVVDLHSKRPAAIQLISHTVKKFKTSATTCDVWSVTPPLPPLDSLTLSPNCMESESPSQCPNLIRLEPPQNLSEYTKLEDMIQLRRTAVKSKARMLMMNKMIKAK